VSLEMLAGKKKLPSLIIVIFSVFYAYDELIKPNSGYEILE
jgi:hypothetical protein